LRDVVKHLKGKLAVAGPLPDWVFPHLPRYFYQALPDGRLPGALLSRDSWAHWVFAAIFAGVFLTLITLLFPRGTVRARQLFLTGVFTSTAGILLLLGLQLLAHATRGIIMVGGGIIGLAFWALKLIGGSYDIALDPSAGFWLSAFGFTISVGLLEEAVKALPVMYLAQSDRPVGWRSLCVVGLASGAGFGIAEGIRYCSDYYNGIEGLSIYLVRFLSCVALHSVWSGSVGIFAAQQRRRMQEISGVGGYLSAIYGVTIVSVILHGFYDTVLKKGYDVAALALAVLTIGVLAAQIEFMRKKEQPAMARLPMR
jgi:RsiW-degrading membrane proteinase PrsW (M82 family)